MGGSGGSYFSRDVKPKDLQQQVRQAEAGARDEKFETDVAALINSKLSSIGQRDVDTIQRHLEQIIGALEKEIEGVVKIYFGGSIAKHTYVDSLSDVDALVILNNTELQGTNPSQVMNYFIDRLRERFPSTQITSGRLAVTLKFTDVEVQLLPALKSGEGVRIPKSDSDDWSPVIRPDRFASKLTEVNRECGGRMIPMIKLARSILSQLPSNLQMNGYHVESLAVKIFSGYNREQTTRSMLKYFFQKMASCIKEPIRDRTGQSFHVDDYLGPAGNLDRRVLADAVGRISRGMQNADGARSIDQWKKILGD